MLLLSCNCHWACANKDESQQQQYYTVTTTIKRLMITIVLNDLCRFICMLLLSHPIFMVLNPIFCYVSPKIVIFHELLMVETHNKCHWIRHASNTKYAPLKQFWCIFASQNEQNVKFLPEIVIFQELLIAETWNLHNWIRHAWNPNYVPRKPFQCMFPSQNQENVKFWLFPELLLTKNWKNINLHREKVFAKACKSEHIGFWVCQSQCTMLELCVTSTFWVIMVFLHFLWEGQDIGFWNMV